MKTQAVGENLTNNISKDFLLQRGDFYLFWSRLRRRNQTSADSQWTLLECSRCNTGAGNASGRAHLCRVPVPLMRHKDGARENEEGDWALGLGAELSHWSDGAQAEFIEGVAPGPTPQHFTSSDSIHPCLPGLLSTYCLYNVLRSFTLGECAQRERACFFQTTSLHVCLSSAGCPDA